MPLEAATYWRLIMRTATVSRPRSRLAACARHHLLYRASRRDESTRGPWTRLSRILMRLADSERYSLIAGPIDARGLHELDL